MMHPHFKAALLRVSAWGACQAATKCSLPVFKMCLLVCYSYPALPYTLLRSWMLKAAGMSEMSY